MGDNMKYTEIFKLKDMLETANIPFKYTDRSFQINDYKNTMHQIECHNSTGERYISIIQGNYTIGYAQDLLEIMGLLKDDEIDEYQREYSVVGYLTAEEVFKRIQDYNNKGRE